MPKCKDDESCYIIGNNNNTYTIIFCHGLGDHSTSWIFFANEVSKNIKNIKFILPNAPSNPVTANSNKMMTSWFDIINIPILDDKTKDYKYIDRSINDIHKIIDSEIDRGISPKNIMIGGFSQGASLSLISCLKYKYELGGIVMFSGWLLNNYDISKFKERLNIPIFIAHGDNDKIVSHENYHIILNALKKSKFKNLSYKIYNNMGHNTCIKQIDDFVTWLKCFSSI